MIIALNNSQRQSGKVFNGMQNPLTGEHYSGISISNGERELLLLELARGYFRSYGRLFGIRSHDDSVQGNKNGLRNSLSEVAQTLPNKNNRALYFEKFLATGNGHKVRVMVLPVADRLHIPREHYDSFYYVFIDSIKEVDKKLAKFLETRPSGILEIAIANARVIAEARNEKLLDAFERILDNALRDSEIFLNPLLSKTESKNNKLRIKVFFYIMLAAKEVVPDTAIALIDQLSDEYPLDYYVDKEKTEFKMPATHDRNGVAQLLYETALTMAHLYWTKTNGTARTFEEHQTKVEVVQFFEDIALMQDSIRELLEKMTNDS